MTDRVTSPAGHLWEPWSPSELALRLASISRPWCVVGGWAIDLWLGQQTRPHGDLEITVLRNDFEAFRRALHDLDLYAAKDGVLTLLPVGEPPGADIQQVWCFDPVSQVWRVDVMIEPGSLHEWVYKRDHTVRFLRAQMVLRNGHGIPYLKPSAALLFKARHERTKDNDDFFRTLPTLTHEERSWLKLHLLKLHPTHQWIAQL